MYIASIIFIILYIYIYGILLHIDAASPTFVRAQGLVVPLFCHGTWISSKSSPSCSNSPGAERKTIAPAVPCGPGAAACDLFVKLLEAVRPCRILRLQRPLPVLMKASTNERCSRKATLPLRNMTNHLQNGVNSASKHRQKTIWLL